MEIKLKIAGREYDFADLELDDLELIEHELGASFDEVNWASAKPLKLLVWLLVRHDQPAFTREEAGKIKIGQLLKSLQGDEVPARPLPLRDEEEPADEESPAAGSERATAGAQG